MALTAGSSLGPYKIIARIGAGGMGEVYRARDPRLARDVAIKVVSPEFAQDSEHLKRFAQEARAAGTLNHPNLCTIFDVGTDEHTSYVVMELLEGESLRARLRSGPLPVRKALEFAAQVARGLAVAHAKGIVHRDLKPENLFVTRDGRVKVLDFGLAKLMPMGSLAAPGDETGTVLSTEKGTLLGTVGYMAPEQVRGQVADARSDLFALGVVLHEMLTGRRVFERASFVETAHAILNDEPEPLSNGGRSLPSGLDVMVRRCLEKAPEERFQSAQDLAFDLEFMASADSGSHPSDARRVQVNGFQLLTVVLLAGAVGAAAGAAWMGRRVAMDPYASQETYHRLTLRRGVVVNARFAADGRSVVYTAVWDGGAPETYQSSSRAPTESSLGLKHMIVLSVSSSDQLAVKLGFAAAAEIARPGTLAVVPPGGGAPRPLLEDVVAADWLPDGTTLVVTRRAGAGTRLEMPPGHTLYETAADLRFVRVSPNGRWIAVIENPVFEDTRGSVLVIDRTGHVSSRTSEWNSLNGALVWSNDSREVWFNGTRGEYGEVVALTPGGRLRTVRASPGAFVVLDRASDGRVLVTSNVSRLGIRARSPLSPQESEAGWFGNSAPRDISSDGRLLLFDEVSAGGGNAYATFLRRLDGSPPIRLGDGRGCSLSPDNAAVLTIRFGARSRLVVLPTGAGDSTSIPSGPISKYSDARWLPDGKRFVFTGFEEGHGPRTYLQALGDSLPRPITPEGTTGVVTSPDGKFVAAVSAAGELGAWPVDGGKARRVSQLLSGEQVYQWSDDGRSIWVGAGGNGSITRIGMSGGNRIPWKTLGVDDLAGCVFLSMVLTRDGSSYAYRYSQRQGSLFVATGLR